MIQNIIIAGLASKKIVKTIPIPDNIPCDLSLLNFLIENKITIASSCGGVGTCNKCLVNKTLVSCQITLNDFIKLNPTLRVEISYL